MEDIIIREVYRAFGEKEVLHGFSARLQAGTITGLMAPSGSGKTTLLRILMGLDRPQQGKITGLDGLRVSAVFQEDRLCENLNAVANIRLVTPVLTLETVEASLKAVGLGDSSRQPVRRTKTAGCHFAGAAGRIRSAVAGRAIPGIGCCHETGGTDGYADTLRRTNGVAGDP